MRTRALDGLTAVLLLKLPAATPANDACWANATSPTQNNCDMMGCLHVDGLPDEWLQEYPLTPERLARSVPYVGDTHRLQEIMIKAIAGGKLNVVALGGSVTLGHWTLTIKSDRSHWLENSWMSRIEAWLVRRFPAASVTVQNRARSSCHAVCQTSMLMKTLPPAESIDLVLMDISINDGYNVHFKQVGLDKLKVANEVLVRHALSLPSKPAIIYLEAVVPNNATTDYWDVQEWVTPIMQPYGVNMVSYRDAVWPVFANESEAVRSTFWEILPTAPKNDPDGIHSSWRAHVLYANTLAHFLDTQYAEACSVQEKGQALAQAAKFKGPSDVPVLAGTADAELLLSCNGARPSVLYDVESPDTHSSISLLTSSGWALYEESLNRAGVIGFGLITPHAVLEIELKCRDPAVVSITYLESYEQMGAVRVTGIRADTAGAEPQAGALSMHQELVIDAMDSKRHGSGPSTVRLHLPVDSLSATHEGAEQNTSVYRLLFTLLGPPDVAALASSSGGHDVDLQNRGGWKFKLLGLACC
eukprot:TRINITY_DN4620_c0_g1_i1.p1 TRINITY_DN4620_c0_g1~~TRINITY_DN4620_c0_g1_i1.p1  ORF type:complete len:530 (+),score=41.73 TRINITY_DN4620_c0_g1_i1:141-1730(+)